LPNETIKHGEEKEVAGFMVKAVASAHGPIPAPPPHNFGFIIDGKFFHPGDSISANDVQCDVLALPISAPWSTWVALLEFGRNFKPKTIIPIHEKVYAEYFIPRVFQISSEYFEKFGIEFKPLTLGEKLEI